LAYNPDFKLIWVSKKSRMFCGHTSSQLKGKNLTDLIKPVYPKTGHNLFGQFKRAGSTFHFNLTIKPGTNLTAVGATTGWRMANLEQVKCTATIVRILPTLWLARILPRPYRIEQDLAEFRSDFFLFTDSEFKIIDFDERAAIKLMRAADFKLLGRALPTLLKPGPWQNFLETAPPSNPQQPNRPWQSFFHSGRQKKSLRSRLYLETPEAWNTAGGKIRFLPASKLNYAWLEQPFPFQTHNFKITCRVSFSGHPNFGIFFGARRNLAATFPEDSGYVITLNPTGCNLKRLLFPVMVNGFTPDLNSGPMELTITLKFNHIALWINGKVILEYRDPDPIDFSGDRVVGFSASDPLTIHYFSIDKQKNPRPPENLELNPGEVRFSAFPEDPYKIQIQEGYYFGATVKVFQFIPINEVEKLRQENVRLAREVETIREIKPLGQSPAMKAIFDLVESVAPTEASVLILGETGTGKGAIADWIHFKSPRKERPMVKIDCGVLHGNLLESELFGHEKGAFTGAHARKKGFFETADGGTVFLDEIGNLGVELQGKLLQVIQEKTFTRLGGTQVLRVDIRILAATNIDPKTLKEKGLLRSDLYYRLAVFSVTMPPLRDRPEDIPVLVNHFIGIFSKKNRKRLPNADSGIFNFLKKFSWPGNVRELKNAVEHAVVMAPRGRIRMEDFPEAQRQINLVAAPGAGAGKSTERADLDLGKFRLNKRQQKIMDYFFSAASRDIPLKEIVMQTQENYRTTQYNLGILKKIGLLNRTGKTSGVLYGLVNKPEKKSNLV